MGPLRQAFTGAACRDIPKHPAPRLRPAERTPADLREGLSRWQTWTALAVACVAKNPLRQAVIEGHQISRCGRPPTLRAGWSVRRTARGPWSVANRKALLTWSPPDAGLKQNTPAVTRGLVGGTREQHVWWPASRWVRSDRQQLRDIGCPRCDAPRLRPGARPPIALRTVLSTRLLLLIPHSRTAAPCFADRALRPPRGA